MNKYVSRILSSERGETFNPLTWPFLLATLAYGIGFTVMYNSQATSESSLFLSMMDVYKPAPLLWGFAALVTIVIGGMFTLFRTPPIGKVSGLIGFMVWVFAAFCWILTGGWLLVFSIAIPNAWFWFWQYLSLAGFRKQDAEDKATLTAYEAGSYDDEDNPKDAKKDRECNRGMDLQSGQTYDKPDDGTDLTRCPK